MRSMVVGHARCFLPYLRRKTPPVPLHHPTGGPPPPAGGDPQLSVAFRPSFGNSTGHARITLGKTMAWARANRTPTGYRGTAAKNGETSCKGKGCSLG